jgi:exodeoxyribonuclease VII small subunit
LRADGDSGRSLLISRGVALSRAMCKAAPTQGGCVSGKKARVPDFEKALGELEAVVERLEHGDLPLEEALRQFERGIELARSCESSLRQAEQKVEILLQKKDDAPPEPFAPED